MFKKIADQFSRFFVGGLFIFSGLIKLNDPIGTQIKLEEYFEVCERISVRYPDIDIAPILVLVARNSQVVESPPLAEQISRDLDDDKFIACAIASDTRTIISGDNDLLTVSGYERVQVMTPRDFVDKHIL